MNMEKFFSKNIGFVILIFLISILLKDSRVATIFMTVIAFGMFLPLVIKHRFLIEKKLFVWAVMLSLLFIVSSIINDSLLQHPLKFISYIIIFFFGYILCYRNIEFCCNKRILQLAILLPILCYIFIFHRKDGGLFDLANTYVYYGLAISILYYLIKKDEKKSIRNTYIIFLLYVLSSVKLGILVAFVIVYFIYSMNNLKRIFNFTLVCIIGIIAVANIDIPVFLRIRNVYELATNIPVKVYTDISNVSAYEIGEMYGKNFSGDNDTSFVFRLIHWSRLFNVWFTSSIIHILFGYGDMYVKNNYTLQPHNEYVKFLFENGLIVFFIIVAFVYKSFICLKDSKMKYLLLTPFAFFLTENLVYFSCMNFYIFLALGYFYCQSSRSHKNIS